MATLFVPGHLPLIQVDRMLKYELKFKHVESIKPVDNGIQIKYHRLTYPEIIAELESCAPEPFIV